LRHVRDSYGGENLKIIFVTPCTAYKGASGFDAVLTSREFTRLFAMMDVDIDLYPPSDPVFDLKMGIDDRFVSGGCSDYNYSLCVLQAAYLGAFDDLYAALTVTSMEDRVHELVFDSDRGFFNALVIGSMSRARRLLDGDVTRYNVVEFHPCPGGCLGGGGQFPATSNAELDARREILRAFKGEIESTEDFISGIISAYDRFEGGA